MTDQQSLGSHGVFNRQIEALNSNNQVSYIPVLTLELSNLPILLRVNLAHNHLSRGSILSQERKSQNPKEVDIGATGGS